MSLGVRRRGSYAATAVALMALCAPGLAQPQDSCPATYRDPIKRDLTPKDDLKIPIRGIEMTFREEQKIEPKTGLSYTAIIPTVLVRGDMDKALGEARAYIEQRAREAASGLDVGSFSWSTSASLTRINMPGSVGVSKWLKMDGICCHWFKCRRCEWKTKLFDRTIHFSSWIDRNIGTDRRGVVAPPQGVLHPQLAAAPAEGIKTLTLKGAGKTKDDRNTLDRVWDFIGGLLEAVDHLFNGSTELQFEDIMGRQFGVPDKTLDPEALLKNKLEDYAYTGPLRDLQRVAEHRQRSIWQAFNSALFFDADTSGFLQEGGGTRLNLSYAFDYDRYFADTTRDIRTRARARNDDEVEVNVVILEKGNFCAIGREQLEQYMDRLRDRFNGVETPRETIEVRRSELWRALTNHYKMSGADEYLRSQKLVTPLPDRRMVRAEVPALSEVMRTPGSIPARGSILALAAEQGWSEDEIECASRLARKRSGSRHLVYPFQSFDLCLSRDRLSRVQTKILDRILSEPDAQQRFTVSSAYVGPLAESAQYRGWYYCYRNLSMCAGKNRIMWNQAASKFDARGGTHKGVDLIDSTGGDATIAIRAVADGKLAYNGLDAQGWGHALILPFQKGSTKYMAVYAHLPASAKSLDGKTVKAADPLGLAGCSGNAGDGAGNCNDYCEVLNAKRTDIHLHFEIIEIQADNAKKKVDPQSVIDFPITSNGAQTLYNCKTPPARVAGAEVGYSRRKLSATH